MDRRAFFALNRKTISTSATAGNEFRQITTGLNAYTGAWTTAEVAHLLKRTMFGATKADIDFFRGMSMSQAVDTLLNVAPGLPAPPVKNYNNDEIPADDPDYAIPMGNTWVNSFSMDENTNRNRVSSWKCWWTGRMINQDRTITEKMVLFWHNHFATEASIYNNGVYSYNHYLLLRQQAVGNFKQLVRAVTIDQAMLRYLDGYLNTAGSADENYARELQELFTLGKENNPNYTEQDVLAAARVLTGWRINTTTGAVYFDATKHDTTAKNFSSFYGGTTIPGRTGSSAGDAELDDLLTMIFNKSTQVSEFIVRKLYRWFCYYTIDANTETNVIKPLALLFRNSNWDIKPVLATLLKSEHFFDPLSQGCLIKSPLEMVVGLCREFNLAFPPANDYGNAYDMWDFVRSQSGDMQQNPGDPPSVSGWPSYYQLPAFYEIWINSDTLPKRELFCDLLIVTGYTRNSQVLRIDPVAFAKTLPNATDPNALINDSLDLLYRVPLSDVSKGRIKKSLLLTNQDQDYYWSNAWNAHLGNPGDMVAYQVVYTRLRNLYKYLMNLAEYQLA